MCNNENVQKYYRAYAEINISALRKNVLTAKENISDATGIIAVIKTDAYGHGAVATAKAIDDLVAGYAVATVEESVELRKAGIRKPIIILGYVSPQEYETVIEHEIIVPILSRQNAKGLSEAAIAMGKKALCHIKADTGMNRIGFDAKSEEGIENTALEIAEIVKLPMLACEGIFMHFATADEADLSKALVQYERFKALLYKLKALGVTFKYRHCSNSAAIVDKLGTQFEWVRQGITLYGLKPSEAVRTELAPVMSLKSHVVHIKTLRAGEEISYGGTYTATEDRTVATVSIGYGDGYPRKLSNTGKVLIHGRRVPIIGRVCMDQLMIDITGVPDVRLEDIVTLIGRDGDEEITAEELGELSGRFNYELVCDINPRVKRIYI